MNLTNVQLGSNTAPGAPFTMNRFIDAGAFKLVINGTGTNIFELTTGAAGATRRFAFASSGQYTMDAYGVGSFTGTAAKFLAVTAVGLVIEEAPPTGTTYTFSNYITESGGAVKLGGDGVDAITTLTLAEKQILLTANTLAGSSALKLTTTSTAAASSLQTMLEIDMTGANATASQSTFGIKINNAHTGTSPINYGVHSTTSGGGRSVYALNTGTGRAIEAANSSTGLAIFASATSGTAMDVQNTTAPFNSRFLMTTAITTTAQAVLSIQHQTSGTANTGFGNFIVFTNETNGNSGRETALYGAKWSNATDATRMGTAFISAYNGSQAIEKLNLYAHYTALTEATATAFLRVNVPSGQVTGGEILVTVEANDATDYQARTIRFIWSAVNKAGTTTITISTPEEAVAVSSGTLTATITAVDSGSGNVDFKIDATSSLTQTTLRANAALIKNFGTGIITPQ